MAPSTSHEYSRYPMSCAPSPEWFSGDRVLGRVRGRVPAPLPALLPVRCVSQVIDFFNVRMDDKVAEGEWSVEKVLQIVVANARTWRGEGMQVRDGDGSAGLWIVVAHTRTWRGKACR